MTERREESHGVGLIATDAPYGRHLAQRLHARLQAGAHPLRAILVIEGARPSPAARPGRRIPGLYRLRRMISPAHRRAHVVRQLEQEAAEEFRRRAGPVPDWPAGVDLRTTPVRGVNSEETAAWLRARRLRLLVLAGAPVLKEPILQAAPETINMHSALLPRYRGTRAEFWQVHNGDLDQAGVTAHVVTSGVDTGDILRQVPLGPAASDGPWLMRARNQLNGLEMMPQVVDEVLAGTAARRAQPRTADRAYRYSDITPEALRTVLRAIGR